MVQETKQISAATLSRQVAVQTAVEAAPSIRTNRTGSSLTTVEASPSFSTRQFPAYAQLQDAKDVQQSAAVADRQRLATAETIRGLAREMRANLMAIVKNYPPFPLESQERQRYLELAVGLRKQMEALTVPPPDKGGPPSLSADGQALLSGLSPQASDADVAAAADALAGLEASLAGFGEEIRASWRSEPMGQDAARQLSAATAEQLAALSGGLGATARIRG